MRDRCPRCFEPAPCRRCVDVPADEPPSWWTIAVAAIAAGALIFMTWNGSLFG